MQEILGILREQARYSVTHAPEFAELAHRYALAKEGPDTPDTLALRVSLWARAERLLGNTGSGPRTPPTDPVGGAPAALREPARLAA